MSNNHQSLGNEIGMEKNVFENYLKLCSSILMILNQRCFFITNQFHALVASKPAKIAG